MTYEKIQVRKMTPRIGAYISGVNLADGVDDQTLQEIKNALWENQVIFFRDQDMTIEQHKKFGRLFGDLHTHPASPMAPEGHPDVLTIHADKDSTRIAGEAWHTDVSCDAEPPMGSILRLHTVPESGGDTMFSSMYAAYDALSDTMKDFLKGLTAVHSGERVYRRSYGYTKGHRSDVGDTFPEHEHPVIRTHPDTGRQTLFVNSGFTSHIKGFHPSESEMLLSYLYAHIARPEFHCRFRWEPGSIAFWDNRCAQHHALWDYYPNVRSGYRVTIKGDRPYFKEDSPVKKTAAA